jgi:RNA polymerase sigma factor (sigma-70 family)
VEGDAELVLAARGGDQAAFAGIYDRYSDRIHDFCHSMLRDRHEAADAMQDTFVLAAQRLGQLREPAKLRSWLFAIARHEALRRAKARRRAVPTEDAGLDVASTSASTEDVVSGRDAGAIVWEAAAGLSDRDRALLDLHLRQGLDGQELADAIGTSPGHAYVLMNRLREQVERSIGALLVARLGRDDCADLRAVLDGWDGTFSPLWRKRVARHVEDCDVCAESKKKLASPLSLLAAGAIVGAPAALREPTLDKMRDVSNVQAPPSEPVGAWRRPSARLGFPPSMFPERRRRRVLGAVAATIVLFGGGFAAVDLLDDGGRESLIAADTERTTTTSTSTTTTAPSVEVTTTTTRPTNTSAAPPPPDTAGPSLSAYSDDPCVSYTSNNTMHANAADPSGVASVTLTATHSSDGLIYSGPMAGGGGTYAHTLGPFGISPTNQTVTWSVTAGDGAGNASTVGGAFEVRPGGAC